MLGQHLQLIQRLLLARLGEQQIGQQQAQCRMLRIVRHQRLQPRQHRRALPLQLGTQAPVLQCPLDARPLAGKQGLQRLHGLGRRLHGLLTDGPQLRLSFGTGQLQLQPCRLPERRACGHLLQLGQPAGGHLRLITADRLTHSGGQHLGMPGIALLQAHQGAVEQIITPERFGKPDLVQQPTLGVGRWWRLRQRQGRP